MSNRRLLFALILAPIKGLAFVVFLPVIGFALVIKEAAAKLVRLIAQCAK